MTLISGTISDKAEKRFVLEPSAAERQIDKDHSLPPCEAEREKERDRDRQAGRQTDRWTETDVQSDGHTCWRQFYSSSALRFVCFLLLSSLLFYVAEIFDQSFPLK